MKKNKGFTLVEVLAAVVVLLMIIVIITPKVFKQLKTAENVTDQEQINAIINTAKLYMNQNTELLPEDDSVYIISLEELKDSGLIKKEQIQNPSTKQELTGCITVQQQNNKYKYEYEDDPTTCNQITVTFDPNGGTVDQTSKNVIIGQKYRSLPTPTREGYKFLGWKGKNLFDKNSFPYRNKYYINSDGSMTGYEASAIYEISIKPNTQYTITNSGQTIYTGYALYDKDHKYITGAIYSTQRYVTFTTTSNTEYIRFSVIANHVPGDEYRYDKDYFQLEEGDTATEYESEYITSSTIVEQTKDHTLYAIWSPSYTVTLNPNGGTISETTKEVTYNELYGELPTPTREGYTFMGWKGNNLFDQDATPLNKSTYIKGDGTIASYSEFSIYQIQIKPNTTYTITNSGSSVAPGYVIYDSNGTLLSGENYSSRKYITFTTPETASYIIFSVVTSRDADRYDREYFKIEEGDTATAWEPFYVTSDTVVVATRDHTLKAIWQEN